MKQSKTTHSKIKGQIFGSRNFLSVCSKETLMLLSISLFLACNTLLAQQQAKPEAAIEAKVRETLKKNAEILRFMENKGQLENKNILYYFEGKKTAVYIEKTKMRFVAKEHAVIKHHQKFLEDEEFLKSTHTFTLNLQGSNPDALVKLGSAFSTRYNYFYGTDPKNWATGIYAAKDLTLEEVYPGINIRLYSSEDGALEFDWIMKAGADYSKINMLLEGQDKLSIGNDGSLNIGLRFTDVKFHIPESYQVTEAGKVPVEFAFNTDGKNTVNFKTTSKIDSKYPLIIDPVLTWGTFMDGNDPDFDQYLFGIQVDPVDGMVYCAGATNRQISTSSPPYDANGYLNVVTGFGTNATPRVAIVYRVNSGGTDLVDLTLYGPGSVTSSTQVAAYALSLSDNRVFIGGRTTDDIPTTGSPFDATRNGNDGFVAIFSKDLGTLHYASYLGSTGAEDLGATSIRAIDDDSYAVGITTLAALPSSYITSGVIDATYSGSSEIWIGKFNNNNALEWGTYVGGGEEETFNDLEVFTDGRVAFAGWGNNTSGTLTEVNPAAAGSNSNADTDGLLGVLNNTATAFNYLDEIGGSGTDKINDVEIINGTMAFTGSVSSGFPTSAGAYDTGYNGGLDVAVGTVSTSGGSASYKATFFGGSGDDIGSGVQKVSQIQCDGMEESFLLVFGTTEDATTDIPMVNVNNEAFFDGTHNGGLDMFFAGFPENVSTLIYSTNIGGQYNDYLGDTGDPRGANHLWVKGANIYVGTTTHSATHTPAIIGGGGFDQVKSNTANPTLDDTHILFSILFSSLLESDYSDAPSSYGAPSHTLDCANIRINSLDAESAAIPTTNADGDDLNVTDDEDGISSFPVYTWGGPQNISVTVNSIINTTGLTATLYGWIDFNNDGQFSSSEFTSTTVANGFSGSKTLTWTGVTVAGSPSNQYLRLRLTTNSLNDDGSTSSVDERSTVSASNGEVEDYYICVKPNAGSDKNVNCASLPGGSATMSASGTGTWTAQAGNPGTATITNTTSPTTSITNYSAAGTYNFIWTNSTSCGKDTVSVSVTAKPNAGANQNVNCAFLPGGTATMAATGTGTWSAQASNPGSATITNTSSPTTTITTFSAAGTYNFIWTNGSCTDTASIVVTAKPNAGVDQNVNCVISFPGGTATMAATGTGSWSAQAGNPGTATITSSGSPTTTIINFSATGTYNFIWTNGSCTDTASVIVTAKPNAGANQNVNCVASFPGGSATMAGTGTGTWTAQTGNPGSATITNSSSPTTTITSFSTAGTYNFIWTNGSCSDTASVVVTAKPNAGVDQNVNCVASFPGGTATMAATGTGTWTAQSGNPGTATITNTASPTTSIINFSTTGTYNFIWTNGSCADTASVIVTAKPNAGNDQSVNCVAAYPGGSATMNASGSGTWSAHPANPPASITNVLLPNTTITNFSSFGTYFFIWTNASGCTDTAMVSVTSKPNAGVDQSVSCVTSFPGGSATMAATGSGTWTAQSGNPGTATINNPNSPSTSIVNYSAIGVYKFIWTNASGCTDTANVTVTEKPNAGPNQNVDCVASFPGGTATMAATGSGTWMAQSGNPGTATITNASSNSTTIINFTTSGTYNFIWSNGAGCTDTASVMVTAKPNAGNNQNVNCIASFPGGIATMNATGSGTWTIDPANPGTATITNSSANNTTITNFSVAGTYQFIWTNSSNCPDTAAVIVTAKPNAGSDKNVNCVASFPGGSASMTASGSGTWTAQAGNPGTATITNTSANNTTITNFSVAGTYNFIWTNASGCPDTASVTVTAKPNAGSNQSVSCVTSFPGGTATMAATGSGTWTAQAGNPGTATINNTTSPTTTIVNFSVEGSYNFIWTNSSGCTDTATVSVTSKPDAGGDKNVFCVATLPGGTATMNATGSGTWTAQAGNPGTATITSNSSPTTTITNFSAAGTYNFIWTNGNNCTDTASVTITVKPNGGSDQSVSCVTSFPGGTATMAATGSGTWTPQTGNPGTATITNVSSPVTTITNFSIEGTYNFIWTNSSNCPDTVSVIVSKGPVGSASPQTICSGATTSIALNSTVPGTTFTWTAAQFSGGSISGFGNCVVACGSSISQTLVNASNTIPGVVRYTVIPTAPNGCVGSSFIVDVTVNPKPAGSASPQTICSGATTSVTLNSTIPGTTFTWTAVQFSGAPVTGFSNCVAICGNTISQILVNTSNNQAGVVRYTVTPISPNGCVGNAFNIDVTVNPKPAGSASPQSICSGATTSVLLNSTVPGTTFTWTAAQFSGAAITGFSNCNTACGINISQILSNASSTSPGVVRYTVTPTSPDGCIGNPFTVDVTVNPKPTGSASPQSICSGATSSVILNSTIPGTTFTWTAAQFSGAAISGFSNCVAACGATISQTLTNSSSSVAGVVRYTVTPTSPDGCIGNSFTVDVTVNPQPVGSASPQTICSGATTSVTLNSTIPGTTFTWTAVQFSGAAVTGFSNCVALCGTTISQSLVNTSNNQVGVVRYTVTPVSPNGCTGNPFTVDVTVNPKPTGSASPQTICSGATTNVLLNATIPGTTFTWTAAQFSGAAITGFSNCAIGCGAIIIQTLNNASSTTPGVVRYTVTPTSPDGCIGNPFTVDVTVNPLPAVNVTTTPACIGFSNGTATAIASGGSGTYSYSWNNGQTTPTISNLIAATYTVTVTDGNGCKNSGSGTVISQGISSLTANPGICQSLTNSYSLTGVITFQNAPSSGTLIVSVGANQQVFNAPFTSPQNYILNGLTADGAVHTVTAIFSGGTNCSKQTNYTAPVNCSPMISHNKTFLSYTQTGINTFDVFYKITVSNTGGAGFYDLKDAPAFDDDIAMNAASYTTDAPGNPAGVLAGIGPWTLANDQSIAANSTHMYTLKVNVTLDLNTGSGGDNVYRKCGLSIPGNPLPGEGLYNESALDTNNDGSPEEKSKACGDLPYVTHDKTISGINPLGGNMYQVNYQIIVRNLGGANAQYDLVDAPGFDDDITINNSSYTSNAPGNPGNGLPGSGPWTLANDQSILVGAIHTYQLSVKVTLDLNAGSGGNNVYKKCGQNTTGFPISGEGLFNKSRIDTNNDGIPDETDEVCGDLPYVTSNKTFINATPLGGNMHLVTYQLEVRNLGGVSGQYDLTDQPTFDDDININVASFTTTVPGNPGGGLIGNGPWILANDQSIPAGALHVYSLTVKVTLDLNPGSNGDNIYRKCGLSIPGNPSPGEGLYNLSKLDSNNDGIPEETHEACGDLPFVTSAKTLLNIQALGSNMYLITYRLDVRNLGGIAGQYDLIDAPGFDNDVAINVASYTSTVPGNPGGPLLGSGPWIMANDQVIPAGVLYSYTITVKVTLDLSAGSGGDNVYRKCGQTIPGDPSAGEGVYNESRMDSNNDGVPEEIDEVCGDLPYVTHDKTIAEILPLGNNMYKVTYKVVVKNSGGTNGQYDLIDIPGFDDDVIINLASFTSDAPGIPGGPLALIGPWILANDENISAGATHTFLVTVKVTLDLNAGSGGDNVYRKCGSTTPGDSSPGEGLYNASVLDTNNDGVAEEKDKVCDDLPYITNAKVISSITPLGGNMYNVSYTLQVKNLGGASGQYDLTDAPGFDNDIAINTVSFTTNVPGNPGGGLLGSGPWTLANDQVIPAGVTHTYVLNFKVTIDLSAGSGGDNVYRPCGFSNPAEPKAGEGLYNESNIDTNNDGISDEKDFACADLPYVTHKKTIANIQNLGGNMYNVTYQIEVKNLGGAIGQYFLLDAPSFDNDIAINNVLYTSNAPGNPGSPLAGVGPWLLAANQSINPGVTHTYTLVVKVTLDLRASSGGDNVYRNCGQFSPGNPTAGEGLFNESRLDTNGDGTPEEKDKACGDLPYIITNKTIGAITALGGNMYQVHYTVDVRNIGGANGQYDLMDAPVFDNDITINAASYTSSVLGNPGALLFGNGPWVLANDQAIPVGALHTYQLSVKVTIDLSAGSSGDNVYRKCGSTTPGDSSPGEGLYNESRIDTNNDGIPEDTDHDCGDLPYLTIRKTISNITPLGGNMYNVSYQVEVKNLGGANGQYDLVDAAGFDDDITINSASFNTNAPFNPGGLLFGNGPWTLANDQLIFSGSTHTYQLNLKVTLDLSVGSGGDNVYRECAHSTPGKPVTGEGLFNEARLDTNNDGVPDSKDSVCGDLPYITHKKSIAGNIQNLGGNMYLVNYNIEVRNLGGATGQYDLTDAPVFDDDISINAALYTSNAPGIPGSPLIGVGPWLLANNESILPGATHNYQITVKVTLDLSVGSGGDNVYRRCGFSIPNDPNPGEGLFNESRIDTNDDGNPDERSKACGDLPYIVNKKTMVSTTPLGGNMYQVNYQIEVRNIGGISGPYDLIDAPAFDDDIAINNASYTSNVVGNPGGVLVGNGPWLLANDLNIPVGAVHTYQLSVKVTIDLKTGSGGDNVYRKCGFTNPGDPNAGEGLFNKSIIDTNNDGIPEHSDKVCGDIPYIIINKTISDISPLGSNMYNVTYQLVVRNIGGANGQYDLSDAPSFDNDIAINTASYISNVIGNPGGPLAGFGPWILANDQSIISGGIHTYFVKVKVTLDLSAGSGGDNDYRPCGSILHGPPSAGEGLFNEGRIDTNNDGIADDKESVCGDLPYITHRKTFVSAIQNLGGNMYNITYNIEVRNLGGAAGTYDLTDAPSFDDDIVINGAAYTSSIVSNPGGPLIGSGPWILSNNQSISAGAVQNYQIIVKVTLDLNTGSSGDNVYRKCGFTNPADPASGEGLFNESRIDTNDDGTPDERSKACGDLPYIINRKTIVSTTPLGGNMFQLQYQVEVRNIGGAPGQYDLIDAPAFDDDIAINSASFSSTVVGNPGGSLAGNGPWLLANDQNIAVGVVHTYQLIIKVTLDLSVGSGGDNVYRKCGFTNPGDPTAGEGLFNRAIIDTNNDGIPENTDKVCGDIPYITIRKTIADISPLGGNMYNLTYQLEVKNLGGANGQYDLADAPAFDNDFTINSASYTSTVIGNPGGPLFGSGPWSLANDQSILAGATHTYILKVKATLDLTAGSGGDNEYKPCGSILHGPPSAGEGLFNEGRVDTNNDGVTDAKDSACGDVPYITHRKTLVSAIQNLGGNMYNITYNIEVKNIGGATGSYDLTDAPSFDDDININGANYTSSAIGNPGGPLFGNGPWTLANNQSIAAGATQNYQVVVKVTLDLSSGSGGDNVYKKCGLTNPGDPAAGEGLFNESRVDTNDDGTPDERSKACGDLPYIINRKTLVSTTPIGGNMYQVNYQIEVRNLGGLAGQYDLTDTPFFDDDISINSATFTSTVAGNPGGPLVGNGPWLLANDVNIGAGMVQTYQVSVKVTLDLNVGSGGDNIYRKCGYTNPGDPSKGEGLYNQSTIDTNNDGIPENSDKTCGDLPYIINDKSISTITPLGGNMYQVNYKIEVMNIGGATGQYDLTDIPAFDNDIIINNALYTSNVAGNPGSVLNLTGPWKLANDQSIAIGGVHTYQISVKVTLDLNPSSGGDNVYRECGRTTPNSPSSGEGLFNESQIDMNNDGIPEHTDKVCGDLPYVTSTKTISSVNPLGGNMFEITYQLQVKNIGGMIGQYDLTDAPGFDNDITINNASFTSNVPGLPGAPLIGSGPWKLANDITIGVATIHTYLLKVKVTLDLTTGSGGDNVYKKCGQAKPGDISSGEGIFNELKLDNNNDGIPEETVKVCGDLPYVTHEKFFMSATSLGNDMYNIVYNIVVKNTGGVNGQYDLIDAPSFDDDITILNASYTSNAPGNAGSALAGTGPWTLANNQSIIPAAVHTYQLTIKVNYNASMSSQGDNVYHKCGFSEAGKPKAGEGLFNESRLDNNDDGIYEEKSKVCGDLPELGKYGSRVWDDKNGNGQRDAGESGIQGILVTLYDAVTKAVERTMLTDANGKYLFENLPVKNYYAKYALPAGYIFTKPNQGPDSTDSDVDGSNGAGTNKTTFLDYGEEDLINDAGMMKCATISGDVWYDVDLDGIYDPEEKGINGLKVYIIDAMSGATVATLMTSTKPGTASDDGYYKSNCLNPGMYYVVFERPGHLGASAPYKGTDPNKDSDITHENGINSTKKITLLSGDVIVGLGAGFQIKSLVGDKVWIDQNVNGLQDNGEQPLSGVIVSAFNKQGVKISEGQSGADGKFVLDGLVQGDVYVKFEVPNAKYGFTIPHAGIDDMDSDVDGVNGYGTTKTFKILAGEVRPTIDAGVVSQALALEWLLFNGEYNGSFTELNWVTGVEDGNDHFVVERKHESEKNFSEIGRVSAHADPSLPKHEYSFDDFDVNKSGVYYYRIKQVDRDGRYTFSRTISIRVENDNDEVLVSIYPNPVNDLLKIDFWLPKDTDLEVKVFDANGKAVMIAPFSQFKTKGAYNELLSTANLITGQYVLQITTVSEVIHKKFTVSR